MVKITYIWHDCFVVETPVASLVFDYWLDSDGEQREVPAFISALPASRPLYVFVSHGHKDHFNPAVFAWYGMFDSVRYVVSRDVMKRIRHVVSESSVYSGPKVPADAVIALRPGEVWRDSVLEVRAFPSTDIGDSFWIDCGDMTLFHAGDLNAWVWRDESTEAEIAKALGDYKACLRDIDESVGSRRIDYCFFPVDSRIGTGYAEGAAMFVRRFDVLNFFPMHFALGDAVERECRRGDALRFDLYANPVRGRYVPLAVPGSTLLDATSENAASDA